MLKRVLAVFLGFLAGFVTTGLIQMVSARMYPPPEDLITRDIEALEIYFTHLPSTARLIMLVAHIIGAFIGSFLAARMADRYRLYLGLLVGVVMLVASISYNLASFAPAWAFMTDLAATAGVAYLGARLGSRN